MQRFTWHFFEKKVELTRCREFVREILDEFVPGDIGNGTEKDDGSDEPWMPKNDTLVSREFAECLCKDDVIPVILKREKKDKKKENISHTDISSPVLKAATIYKHH